MESLYDRVECIVIQKQKGGRRMGTVYPLGEWTVVPFTHIKSRDVNGKNKIASHRISIPDDFVKAIGAEEMGLIWIKREGDRLVLKKAKLAV